MLAKRKPSGRSLRDNFGAALILPTRARTSGAARTENQRAQCRDACVGGQDVPKDRCVIFLYEFVAERLSTQRDGVCTDICTGHRRSPR